MKKSFNLDNKVQNWQKNLIFRFFLIAIIGLGFITLDSCNKEADISGLSESKSSVLKMAPMQKVNYFRAIVEKKGLESRDEGGTYTAEEAVLGVETLLNYDYDDFTERYIETRSQKDTITISKNNGVIDDGVIADLNEAVLNIMQCHFASVDSTNKKEMFVDMYNVSDNAQEFQVGVNNVVGIFPTISLPGQASFGPGDDWKANYGKCDGSHPESNAPRKIASYTTWNVGINYATPDVWFSDFEWEIYSDYPESSNWFAVNPNDPNPGDWIIDYFEWKLDACDEFAGGYGYDPCDGNELPRRIEGPDGEPIDNPDFIDAMCIDYPEMNYYLANAESEALKFEPILNKEFLHIEMDFYAPLLPNEYYYSWWGKGAYAKKMLIIQELQRHWDHVNKSIYL